MGSKPMTTEQSTFMIDLHQVGMMLRYHLFSLSCFIQLPAFMFLQSLHDDLYRQATPRSLCLLDEFGKGTLTEG